MIDGTIRGALTEPILKFECTNTLNLPYICFQQRDNFSVLEERINMLIVKMEVLTILPFFSFCCGSMVWAFGFDGGYLPYCCILLVVLAMSIHLLNIVLFNIRISKFYQHLSMFDGHI
jgi:hypothetical protein